MSFSFAIFTFLNVWWVSLFIVLPFGVTMATHKSAVEYNAAPVAHRWKKVFIINSGVSLCITIVLALLIHNHVVSLDNLDFK